MSTEPAGHIRDKRRIVTDFSKLEAWKIIVGPKLLEIWRAVLVATIYLLLSFHPNPFPVLGAILILKSRLSFGAHFFSFTR